MVWSKNLRPLVLTCAQEPKTEFSSAWLLPVFKDSIEHADLAFFSTHVIPLTQHLRTHWQNLAASGRDVHANLYQTLHAQVLVAGTRHSSTIHA